MNKIELLNKIKWIIVNNDCYIYIYIYGDKFSSFNFYWIFIQINNNFDFIYDFTVIFNKDIVIKFFLYNYFFEKYIYKYYNYNTWSFKKVKIIKLLLSNRMIVFKKINNLFIKDIPLDILFSICNKWINIKEIVDFNFIHNIYDNNLYRNLYEVLDWYLNIMLNNNFLKNNEFSILKEILENWKQDFLIENNIYFVHWDLTRDNILFDWIDFYLIDFWESWLFDIYYNYIFFHEMHWVNINDIKKDIVKRYGCFYNSRWKFSIKYLEIIKDKTFRIYKK